MKTMEIKWIDPNKKLPQDGDQVVLINKDRSYIPVVGVYHSDHKKQFIVPFRDDWGTDDICYWAILPEPK